MVSILFHQWVYLFKSSIVAYMFTAGWDWDFRVFPSHTGHSFNTMSIGHQGWRLQVRIRLMSPCSMIHISSVFCNDIFSSRSGEWPGALPIVCDSWRSIYKTSFAKNSKKVSLFLPLGISYDSFGCIVGLLFPPWRITPWIFLNKITMKVFFKNNATDIC